jgi:beta-phosphoglucomutase
MDGVLVDTGRFHLASWADILIAAGHAFDAEIFRRTFGMNNHGVLSTVFGRPPSADELIMLADRKEALFRELIAGQAEPLPGVRDWLARLHARGVRQAVASSAPQANIDVLLDSLGIRAYFDAEVSAEKMPGKPDPAVFLEAARRVGLPPARCVVVEDAIAGVAAAKRAGMACLAVTTTNPAAALAAADLVVDSLADLPEDAFDRLLAGPTE